MKRTKIGATLGPACRDATTIEAMVKAGLNFARLNFSHGTYPEHAKLITTVRAVEKITGEPIAIMQDLQGPKMRLGTLPEAGITVKNGQTIFFNTKLTKLSGKDFPITYPGLEKFLKAGEHMLIDDGRVEVKISAIKASQITVSVIQGGTLSSHKGLNFPNSKLSAIPALSKKDIADVAFGVKQGVDIISLSFVKHAKDIVELKKLIAKNQTKKSEPIFVVAKIERPEAVRNLKEIIQAADGIMVARGDLGLEMPGAKLAVTQKNIIAAARAAGKPVIVATQMLDSMQHSRRPTRAEATDVANAVIDHADGLLLTNETAVGEFPTETVTMMRDIIVTTEKSAYDDVPLMLTHGKSREAAAELSRFLAEEVKAKVILAEDAASARIVSHVRPELPILVASASPKLSRQLNMFWGVRPFKPSQSLVKAANDYVIKNKLAKKGDNMIVVEGNSKNAVEVREIK